MITGVGRSGNLRLWVLVACAGLMTVACDKLPLLAPPSSTIKLSSASTNVQANGTTEVRATVLEPSGTPVQNGTTVTFTTNLGTVSPVDARTLNGVATVQFLGNGQSGKATVRAISGGAASDPLELSVGAAAAGRVVVTANPNQVAPGSPSTITATVTDASSNPLSGVMVSFSTDNGSLSSAVSSTSSNGQAQAVLVTSRDATVTATVGTGTATTATVKVTVGALPEITINPSGNPTEGQPVTFGITVAATGSTESFQSIVVDFGDGTNSGVLSGGTQSVSHTYARQGTYLVEATGTASSGNSKRATALITVAPRAPLNFTLSASPNPTTTGSITTFTVTFDGATPTNVSRYDWNFGDGATASTTGRTTNHVYKSAATRNARVTVRTTDGNSGSGETEVIVN